MALCLLAHSENIQERMGERLVSCDSLLGIDAGALVKEISEHCNFLCVKFVNAYCFSQLIQDWPRGHLRNRYCGDVRSAFEQTSDSD